MTSNKNLEQSDHIMVECSVQVERLDISKYKMLGALSPTSQPCFIEEGETKPKKADKKTVVLTTRTLRSRKKDINYAASGIPQKAKVRGTFKNPDGTSKKKEQVTRRDKSRTQEESEPIVEPRARRGQKKIAELNKNCVKSADDDKENNKETAEKDAPEDEFIDWRCVVEVEKLTAKQVADLEENGTTTLQGRTKTGKSINEKNLKVTRKVLRDRGAMTANANRAVAKHDDSVASQQTKSTKVSSVKIQEFQVLVERLPKATLKSLTSKEETHKVTKRKKVIPIRTAKTTRAAAAKQILEASKTVPSNEISSMQLQSSRVVIERLPSVTAPKIAKSLTEENPDTSTLSPKSATPLNKFQNVTRRVNKRKDFPAVEDESPKRSTRRNYKDKESIPQKMTFDEKVTLRRGEKDKKNTRKSPTRDVANYSVSPPQAVHDITSPSSAVHSSPSILLKVIEKPDNRDDHDPYSFEMSQSEAHKKKIKKSKKQVPKSKPGNKIDILMMQKALDAIENSCNVQNNPTAYEAQRENIEKQIKISAPQVIDVDAPSTSRMAAQLSKVASSTQKETDVPVSKVKGFNNLVPSISRMALSKATTSHSAFSKVYHSPQKSISPNYDVSPGVPSSEALPSPNYYAATSQSPPIQSTYALKMISALRKGNFIQNVSSPFRVPGNLPTTFYMGLSGNDGAPTYSSDLLGEKRTDNFDDNVNSQHEGTGEKSHNSTRSESFKSPDNSVEKTSDETIALGDSNAENLEPIGMVKSPIKKVAQKVLRSPFKSLPLPELPENEVSYLSIANSTVDQVIALKNKTVVDQDKGNESLDLLEICEKGYEKQYQHAGSSGAYRDDPESSDAFGFDELLGNDRRASQQPSVSKTTDSDSDIRQHLQKFKQYLPSNNYKNRDKNVFPTSSINESAAFKEPSTSQSSVKEFFSSSTPIATAKKNARLPFADMSKIAEASETTVDNTNDESVGELFEEDQTELYRVS